MNITDVKTIFRKLKITSSYVNVSPVPLGSKESRDPPTLKSGRWLRVKFLHSIMIHCWATVTLLLILVDTLSTIETRPRSERVSMRLLLKR